MSAGALNEKITIERETTTGDGSGGSSSSWAQIAAPWSKAKPVRGTESVKAGQAASVKTWLFTVRKGSDTEGINASDRVRAFGQVLKILSVRPGGPDGSDLRAWLTIEAETQVGVS